jgi:hypothetical protein
MPTKLNLWEKCYLIALYGDVPMVQRERLFSVSSYPPQAGPLVFADGREFIGHLDNGRIAVRKPRSSLLEALRAK